MPQPAELGSHFLTQVGPTMPLLLQFPLCALVLNLPSGSLRADGLLGVPNATPLKVAHASFLFEMVIWDHLTQKH